jgi:hypothetical protein
MSLKIYSPGWIDDDRLFAALEEQGPVAIINRMGKVQMWLKSVSQKAATPHLYPGLSPTLDLSDADIGSCDEGSRFVRAVPKRSDLVLLQNHYFMSDGGFSCLFEVDVHHGIHEFVDFENLEDIRSDGRYFVGSTSMWVGGYKRPGAARLNRLYVWNVSSLKCNPIGLKYMIVDGACFLKD